MSDINLGEFAITEPESAANTANPPQWPFNNVRETSSGHLFEMDDTPSRERVRLTHRTGTFIEMHPDGSQVNHIFGDSFHVIENNGKVLIKGVCSIVVEGNASIDVHGDLDQRVVGNMKTVVGGDYDLVVSGEVNIVGQNDVDINSGLGGSITLGTTDLFVNATTRVNGRLSAEQITSTNDITAGTGIHAGVPGSTNPLAGISTLGGLSLGFPQTTNPPTLTSIFPIFAPTVTSIELIDHGGPVSLMRVVYNSHIHPTPRGPSGPPSALMAP
jgi:hypothetical protein